MKYISLFLFVFTSNLALCQTSETDHLESNGFDAKRLSNLTLKLKELSDTKQIPGSVTLITRNNQIVYHEAFGYSDFENKIPMTKDKIFRIASQTKFVTAVAIMMLQERGELVTTDKVSKFIPEFKETTVAIKTDNGYKVVPAIREVTIKDLLTHTSGIGYGFGIASQEWINADIQGFYTADRNETILETVKKIAKLPHNAHPGTEYVYGYSFDILGAVVEVVSGQSFEDFLKTNIFDPLDMVDTSFYLPISKKDRFTTVYLYSEKDGFERAPDNGTYDAQGKHYVYGPKKSFSGGAGLLSTSTDFSKFLLMMINGGKHQNAQILSRKSIELMTKDNLGDVKFPYAGMGFGLGVQVIKNRASLSVLGSDGEYVGGGAYRTEFWVDPKEDITGIILVQLRDPQYNLRFHDTIKSLIYQALR